LEKLIILDDCLARLHRDSAKGLGSPAVSGEDKKGRINHPAIIACVGGTFIASASPDGGENEVDSETEAVIMDEYQESGNVYKVHPDSGITIKGFQIPKWDELVQFVDEIMNAIPDYGYVGWDLVLTPD